MVRFLAAIGLALGLAACDEAGPAAPVCIDDQCDGAASLAELLAALEGHDDPVARYLRDAAGERGTLVGDYRDVLDGIGAEVGCAGAREKSFVVLSNLDLIPKAVIAECADDPQAASGFLAAIPALRLDGTPDLDPQIVHLAAWDEPAGTYRTYSTRPDSTGEMTVNVAPSFCLGCHGGPLETGFWQPLMNEMTNPWSGWNAEPGFQSQLFDEVIDPAIAGGATYRAVSHEGLLDSASNLEPIVRAGIDWVVGARLRARDQAADLESGLALLRPVFCDETVNFVSEIHDGGEIRTNAVVDRAAVALFAVLDHSLPWAVDTTLHLPAAPDGGGLTLVPVRGESSLAVELGLVARRALEPAAALRVRALDHGRPVLSDFRCQLWRRGAERLRAGAIADQLAALPASATTADLLPLLFDHLMNLEVEGGLVPLTPPAGAAAIAFADATAPEVAARLAAGDLADLAVDLDQLDARLAAQLADASRAGLAASRDARACEAIARFAIAPIYLDLACP